MPQIRCPQCSGFGTTIHAYQEFYDGTRMPIYASCSRCRGFGLVQQQTTPERKSVRQLPPLPMIRKEE